MFKKSDFKRNQAELSGDNRIVIHVDSSTSVSRKIKESDKTDYPDLFKEKPKRTRRKKVVKDNELDVSGVGKSGAE